MEQNDWLISVLIDLETYARENELPNLSKELAKTRMTATAETGVEIEVHTTTDTDINRVDN